MSQKLRDVSAIIESVFADNRRHPADQIKLDSLTMQINQRLRPTGVQVMGHQGNNSFVFQTNLDGTSVGFTFKHKW